MTPGTSRKDSISSFGSMSTHDSSVSLTSGSSLSPTARGCTIRNLLLCWDDQLAVQSERGPRSPPRSPLRSDTQEGPFEDGTYEVALWSWTLRPLVLASLLWSASSYLMVTWSNPGFTQDSTIPSHERTPCVLRCMGMLPLVLGQVWFQLEAANAPLWWMGPGVCTVELLLLMDFIYSPWVFGHLGFFAGFCAIALILGKRKGLGFAYALWFAIFMQGLAVYIHVAGYAVQMLPGCLASLPQLLFQLYLASARVCWSWMWGRWRHQAPRQLFVVPLCATTLASDLGYMIGFLACLGFSCDEGEREAALSGEYPEGHVSRVMVLFATNFITNMVNRGRLPQMFLRALCGSDYELTPREDVQLRTRWSSPYVILPSLIIRWLCWRYVGHTWAGWRFMTFLCMFFASMMLSDVCVFLLQYMLHRRQGLAGSVPEMWQLLQQPGGHTFPRFYGTGADAVTVSSKLSLCRAKGEEPMRALLCMNPDVLTGLYVVSMANAVFLHYLQGLTHQGV